MKDTLSPVYLDTRARYRTYVRNAVLRSWFTLVPAVLATSFGVIFLMVQGSPMAIGAGYALLGTASVFWLIYTYAMTTVTYQTPPVTVSQVMVGDAAAQNIGDALTWSGVEVVGKSTGESLGIEEFTIRILQHGDVKEVMRFLGIPYDQLHAMFITTLSHVDVTEVVKMAVMQAAAHHRLYVSAVDLFGALLSHANMRNQLRVFNLTERDVTFATWWWNALEDEKKMQRRWWDANTLLSFTGVGMSWAAGYTPFLDLFVRIPAGNIWDQPYGHSSQVAQLITSLARDRQSNALLVGQPGVGRLGVIKELARRIDEQEAHPALNGQRVAYINIAQLLSMGSSGAQQLQFLSKALAEMERAGNIIAVLDGLGSILGSSDEQRVNFSDVIMPFFSSPQVRVVVVMSTEEYHERVKNNEELTRVFEVVQVPPLSRDETLQLLALTKPSWEEARGVYAPYIVLREVVEVTENILPYVPFPEKAFDIVEELIVNSQQDRKVALTMEDLHALITQKTGIALGRINALEGERLLNLDEFIHKRVVNQTQGVAAVAKAMVRARTGVRDTERPIGTFLFLGPTGVGKTETAKALAEAFFGSDEYMQRLDMTEFQGGDGVQQLIGGPARRSGRLTSLVADNPYAVLLLDEFEKADTLVKQMFLPVFDEGYITDSYGRRYSFRNTIIIATSNAGAELIRTSVEPEGGMPDGFTETLQEHILSQGLFRPEELNRFDGVITFTPLTQEHIRKITVIMLKKLNKRLDAEHGVSVKITDDLVEYLVSVGYDPEFGARPMKRAIQDSVEYALARRIAGGLTQPGTEVVLDVSEFA